MNDTVMTVIAIFLAAVLMFGIPTILLAERQDDIAQTKVTEVTATFTNDIAIKGKITQDDYNAFIDLLNATGNTYDVEFEIQHLDTNPGKKVNISTRDQIGENIYYSTYTNEVMDKLDKGQDYLLKKGDNVIVTIKNTNRTIAEMFRNAIYQMTGKGTVQISTSQSALVLNTGR